MTGVMEIQDIAIKDGKVTFNVRVDVLGKNVFSESSLGQVFHSSWSLTPEQIEVFMVAYELIHVDNLNGLPVIIDGDDLRPDVKTYTEMGETETVFIGNHYKIERIAIGWELVHYEDYEWDYTVGIFKTLPEAEKSAREHS